MFNLHIYSIIIYKKNNSYKLNFMREKRSRDMFKSVQTIKIDEKKEKLGVKVCSQRSQCRTTHKRKDC